VLNVQRPFDLIFQLGMNLAVWGNVFGLFDKIYGYDKVVHFILPCGSAMMLYIALCHLRLVPDLSEDAGLHDRVAMVLVTLAFGLTVGGILRCGSGSPTPRSARRCSSPSGSAAAVPRRPALACASPPP
jgi:hypothetical protein